MALSVIQKLFGGETSKSAPVDATPEWLKAFNNQLSGAFNSVFQNKGDPYTGPQFEGVGANEQNVLDWLAGGQGGQDSTRADLLNSIMKGDWMPGGQQANPFLQQAIADAQRTTNNGLADALGKTLPGKFTQAGHFLTTGNNTQGGGGSSPFDAAAATAFRGAADANASIATQMSNNAWNQGQQQMTQASQISQQEVEAATKKLTALGLPREIQGSNVNLALQTWQANLNAYMQALSAATGVGQNVKIAQNQESQSTGGIVPGVAKAFSAAFPKGA